MKNKREREMGVKRGKKKKKRKRVENAAIGRTAVTWLWPVTSQTKGLRHFAAVSTCQTDTSGRLTGLPDVYRRWESIGTSFRPDCGSWSSEKAGNPHRCSRRRGPSRNRYILSLSLVVCVPRAPSSHGWRLHLRWQKGPLCGEVQFYLLQLLPSLRATVSEFSWSKCSSVLVFG